MDREIKFRAWVKEDSHWNAHQSPHKRMFPVFGVLGRHVYPQSDYSWLLNLVELMQFTGLKDKNGREIYEGDIVKVSYRVGTSERRPVQWDDGAFILRGVHGGLALRSIEPEGPVALEVVGNVYENPDLLKEPA